MAIDVADVKAQFGAYYIAGSQNQANLRNKFYKPIETAMYFKDRPTSDTIWRGTQATLDRVVQPFQKAYTPIGTLTFIPNKFDLYKLKIDKDEYPDDLEPTYEGFLADVEDLDRKNWPFVKWFIENHIMPRKDEDLETNEYFNGVFVDPTPGVAGAAGTSMNGLRKVIRDYNLAGRTNLGNGPIATGAPADSDVDFCTQVETFVDGIPSMFRKKLDYIFMSHDLETKYKRGKAKKYGLQLNFMDTKDKFSIEDYPTVSVKGLESHTGSGLIWTSIPDNRIRPIKKGALVNMMKVESQKRLVSLFTDWWEALNFEVPEFVFHNDQDLA